MEVANGLKTTFENRGFQVKFSGDYPGWSPDPNSAILSVLKKLYEETFHKKPKVVACHAGLECGILGSHYPDLDMISFGPTIRGAHSPDEKASISSSQKFWKYLLSILKNTPKR
jgi:dipeptidase D